MRAQWSCEGGRFRRGGKLTVWHSNAHIKQSLYVDAVVKWEHTRASDAEPRGDSYAAAQLI